ncbi:MAG: hypothetical protein F4Y03_09320 [Alphaproteobacteria bacterium]|nr:hypothetical protein [Alphaproteobacteria bacterium]
MATATLNVNKDFAVGSAGQDATKWKLFDAAAAGNELWEANLDNNPAALTANQFYRIRSGQFVVTQNTGSGGATEEFAKRELKGALGPTVWAQLFDVNSGNDRALTGRVAIQLAEWTIA